MSLLAVYASEQITHHFHSCLGVTKTHVPVAILSQGSNSLIRNETTNGFLNDDGNTLTTREECFVIYQASSIFTIAQQTKSLILLQSSRNNRHRVLRFRYVAKRLNHQVRSFCFVSLYPCRLVDIVHITGTSQQITPHLSELRKWYGFSSWG